MTENDYEPRLVRRENSGWLAVSPNECPFRIGVEAWSADDAKNKWQKAYREWVVVFNLPLSEKSPKENGAR